MAEQTSPSWSLEDAFQEARKTGSVLENVVGKPAASSITGPIERVLGLPGGEKPLPEPSRLPEGIEPALPSTSQALGAFGAGTAEGLLGLTPTAGAITGGILGVKAGAASPIPGGAFFGGLAGTGAGYFTGLQAEKSGKALLPLTRDDLRAYREAGKTFSSSIAMAAPMLGMAVRGRTAADVAASEIASRMPQTSREWVASILQQPAAYARTNPVGFTASETAMAAGAGLGAGLYEAEVGTGTRPEHDAAYRMMSEVVGGMIGGLTPTSLLISNADNIFGIVKGARTRLSPEAQKQMASDYFIRLYEKFNRDPNEARRMLQEEQPAIVTRGGQPGMTAAQLTGFPELSALEKTLIKGNAKAGNNFALEVEHRGQNAIMAFHGLLQDLAKVGTPESLSELAKLRSEHALNLLNGRFELAHTQVADAVAKMRIPRTAQGEIDYGGLINKAMDGAISDSRGYEQELWKAAINSFYQKTPKTGQIRIKGGVAQPLQVEPSNTLRAFYDMQIANPDITVPGALKRDVLNKLEFGPEDFERYRLGKRSREALANDGQVPDAFLKRIDEETGDLVPLKAVNIDDLLNIRSSLLRDMRSAVGNRDFERAHFLDKMQKGILDDMAALDLPELSTARLFSKEFNDYFTRTFASDLVSADRFGAQQIAPEILASKVFQTGRKGAAVTDLRLREIEDAMRFVSDAAQKRYAQAVTSLGESPSAAQLTEVQRLQDAVNSTQGRVASVTEANARLLRMMANESVDETTGELNPGRLARFVQDFKPALDRYNLTEDLTDAVRAQQVFNAIRDPNSYINRTARSQTALANVLRYESPIRAVEQAMASKRPVRDLVNIAKLAKKGGPEEIEGLKTVLFDIAIARSGGVDSIDTKAYKDFFFNPVDRGAPSIAAIMTQQGILSLNDLENMRRMLQPIERVKAAMTNERTVEDLLKNGSLLNDFVVKVAGANLGSLLTKILPGPGNIQTPGFGSQLAQSLLLKEPNILVRGLIEEAMLNPKFQAELLAMPRNQREKFEMKRRMHAYLGASGLNYATFDEPEPVDETPLAPRPARPTMFRPAPSSRGVPGLGGEPPKSVGPQSAAPQGNARAMLQSLFPFDTISALAAQQSQQPAPPPG